jgi:hypothetical protein
MFFGPFTSKASPPDKISPSFHQQCQGNIVATYVTLWPVFPTHHKASFFSVVATTPCKKGSVNYKNKLLINIVADVLPNGDYGWQTIALAYQEQSKEEIQRDTADMKKHWIKVICNGMKKPTGWTGEAGDQIHRCMAIEKKILKKKHSGMMGFLSSEDDANLEGVEMVEENALKASLFGGASASVGGEENAVNNSMESMELANQDDVIIPAPDIPPPCQRLSNESQDDTGNEGVEEVTPNIHAGLRRAEDFMKMQKMKNSSNKNKECTLIAGAVEKLVERQDLGGMAASMSMMLMRQLKAMNSSMERQEQQERKQERRKRKKRKIRKKCHAMR